MFAENSAAKAALLKMNGKELKGHPGRSLKVDFDVRQSAKKSYKTNMSDEGNVRFNKNVKREFKQKHNRKERSHKTRPASQRAVTECLTRHAVRCTLCNTLGPAGRPSFCPWRVPSTDGRAPPWRALGVRFRACPDVRSRPTPPARSARQLETRRHIALRREPTVAWT